MTTQHRVSATRRIAAPAAVAYAIIADYRERHQQILPKAFSNLKATKGGIGAGTEITFDMRLLGKTRTNRSVVAEPEPGRVITERDLDGKIFTTFIVDPVAGGQECDVTIATDLGVHGGLVGMLERPFITRLLQPVFVEELQLLEKVAKAAISG
jgi:hypothetical protein